jgi:hypothetical protein
VNMRQTLWIIVALGVFSNTGDVEAYDSSPGGGTTANACSQVTFSSFTPTPFSQDNNNTEVAPQSAFSFVASATTLPKSITVTIKGESVPVNVAPHFGGFQVTGKIPATFKGTFIRIEIKANGPNQCERGDGWLLKVAK